MSFLSNLPLPPTDGLLPSWMLFISSVALFNTVQTFISPTLSKKVYDGKPEQVTPLSNRTFGIWTLTASMIRLYAAYNIHSKELYNLAFLSYVVAFAHFNSELLVYKTTKFGKGWAGPAIVSTTSLVWMTFQREFYTGA